MSRSKEWIEWWGKWACYMKENYILTQTKHNFLQECILKLSLARITQWGRVQEWGWGGSLYSAVCRGWVQGRLRKEWYIRVSLLLVLGHLDLWLSCSEDLCTQGRKLSHLGSANWLWKWRSKSRKKFYKIKNGLDRSDSISLPNSELVEFCANFDIIISLI